MAVTYLIVCDRPPYGSVSMQESFDMATAGAAFDFPVQVLLRGDGVYGALATQDSDALSQKNVGKHLGALGIYGVHDLYIDRAAMTERNLTEQDLVADVIVLDEPDVLALLNSDNLTVQL